MTDGVNKIPDKKPSDDLKLKDLRNDRLGLDSLMDDMIGLNIQGFKSLLAVCFRPAQYFQSAKLADWGGKYRPSFRLLFAILALTAATRFIWASDTSLMVINYANDIDKEIAEEVIRAKAHGQILDTSNFDSIEAASLSFKRLMIVYPFAIIIGLALFAWVYRIWGETFSYVVRLRYTYTLMIPPMVMGLIMSFIVIVVPEKTYTAMSQLEIILTYILISLTAYFGPFEKQVLGKRIALSLCISILMSSFFMVLISVAWIPTLFSQVESQPRHDHSLPLIKKAE